jgi:hypothetical protein
MARNFWGVSNDRERCVCPSRAIGIDRYELRPMSGMDLAFWRREWDSNPRYGFPYTRFPSERLQPLGHPSAIVVGAAL